MMMNRFLFVLFAAALTVAAVAASAVRGTTTKASSSLTTGENVFEKTEEGAKSTDLFEQLLSGKVLSEDETKQLSKEIQFFRKLAEASSVEDGTAYDSHGEDLHTDITYEKDSQAHNATDDDGHHDYDDGHGDDHGDGHGDGHDSHAFGFHIEFPDLYRTILYFACIYLFGQIAARFCKMPSLVGEIFCGIILGPPLLDIVPNAGALVLIGEVGLILLVIEAGIDIDLAVMKLVGSRGLMIAIVGSFLPIGVGFLIALALNVGDLKTTLAAGAVFGPTSLGIALNVLKGGGVLNTPVGQMIVAAAVIDDMIALVVLSQLKALTGTITVAGVLIPIVSALLFLCLGGFICIFILPKLINKYILRRFDESNHDKIEMAIMFGLLLALMPATYYCKSSYLMGAFLAGLTFCSSDGLHHLFVRQFKRLLQWLMRIFFACTIGFQVPITDFGNFTIIWQGLVFCLAWVIGKITVGFMVPNFSPNRRFTGNHLRDCLITGFSMAAEGEFAFVIAVFAVGEGLVDEDLYASLILAVLISTIIPPFLLRFTIGYYNKKGEENVAKLAEEVLLDVKHHNGDDNLVDDIKSKSEIFLVIQTQSDSTWGLLMHIMDTIGSAGLDVIDHRAWSPRGLNTTLVNEVYAKCPLIRNDHESPARALNILIGEITMKLQSAIDQEDAKVKVQRWFPGVVKEVIEDESGEKTENLRDRILKEAHTNLERKSRLQLEATKQHSIRALLKDHMKDIDDDSSSDTCDVTDDSGVGKNLSDRFSEEFEKATPKAPPRKGRRGQLQKTFSTPVIGGGLFGETSGGGGGDNAADCAASGDEETGSRRTLMARRSSFTSQRDLIGGSARNLAIDDKDDLNFNNAKPSGVHAQITVNRDVFNVRISDNTYHNLKSGGDGTKTDSRGRTVSAIEITASTDDAPVVRRLQGFVRTASLSCINETTD